MPYNFYLILHLFAAFGVVALGTHLCLKEGYSKKITAVYGVLCLVLFIAGFGLLAKGQYSIAAGWASIKLIIFLILASGIPIIAKRAPQLKKIALYTQFCLIFVVIYVATLKPF